MMTEIDQLSNTHTHPQATTYVHLFSVLYHKAQRLNKKFGPTSITMDFKPGLAKAIDLKFIENTMQTSVYLDKIVICNITRRMIALASVPRKLVSILYDDLRNGSSEYERDQLTPLFTHFKNYRLQPTSMWNVFDIPDRTNNSSECTLNQYDNCKELKPLRREIDPLAFFRPETFRNYTNRQISIRKTLYNDFYYF
ncbi:hypothetical protein I4U23_010785 [Adineta vaga]|nr:hypothetical protein I4U23_010785 [Adineta vaga]